MPKLILGGAEIARTDEQLPFTMDSSLGKLRMKDGSIRFFETDMGTKPYYFVFRGTADDPLARREGAFSVDYNGYADRPSGVWVMSVVERAGLWIGVCHREHYLGMRESNPKARAFNFYIGLAVSFDAGMHWKYVGDVCGNVQNNQGEEPNMGGCPTLLIGNYLTFFFNDYNRAGKRWISAARCDADECAYALRRGKLPRVYKYSGNGVYQNDAMLGIGEMIVPGSDTPIYDAHANAAYCAPLGKYLLTVQTHGVGELWLYTSGDGWNWNERVLLDRMEPNAGMQPYSTIIAATDDDSSADMTTVGRAFYVYWTRKYARYDVDTWYRRKITVE